MYCNKCGNHLDESDDFCSKCGNKISRPKNIEGEIIKKKKTTDMTQEQLEKKKRLEKNAKIVCTIKRVISLSFILGLCLLIVVIINENNKLGVDDSTYNVFRDKSDYLSYTIDKEDKDSYSYTITGIVTNNSSSSIDYAQIEFTCYDKVGNNVGTAWANVNNLEANGTWKYEATYLGKDAVKCKYTNIVAR